MAENISATYEITTNLNRVPQITLIGTSPGCPHQSLITFVNYHQTEVTPYVLMEDGETRADEFVFGSIENVPAGNSTGPGRLTRMVIDGGHGNFYLSLGGLSNRLTLSVATFVIYDDTSNGLQFYCNIAPEPNGIQREKGDRIYFYSREKQVQITTYTDKELQNSTPDVIGDAFVIEPGAFVEKIILGSAAKDTLYYFDAKTPGVAAEELEPFAGTLRGCIKIKK